MSEQQTATLEDITTRFHLEVPVHMTQIRSKSLTATRGIPSDYTQQLTEYLMPDRSWTPGNVDMKFSGKLKQYHTFEQYQSLMQQREKHKPAYGRITVGINPLIEEEQREGVTSSVDGVIQTITINCSVHFNHDEEHTIAAAGNRIDHDAYWIEFLIDDSLQRSMPSNFRGALPSFVNLRLTREQYAALAEQRMRRDDAYGSITLTFEPLTKQG